MNFHRFILKCLQAVLTLPMESSSNRIENHPSIQLASQLIACPSISPDDAGAQRILRNRLAACGFDVRPMDVDGVTNTWAELGGKGPLFVFGVHSDVVPSGDASDWTSPPFEPALRDGFLYGRGAADMKGPLAAAVIAAERFVKKYQGNPPLRIGFIITGDEEPVDNHGTQDVLDWLASEGKSIDYCIVTEPTSAETFGDTVKVGRRGSINGFITIHGKQGHAAYPELASNPVHRGLWVLHTLSERLWDPGDGHFPAAGFQITNIHAGTGAANVIPGKFNVQFNVRHGPGLTLEAVETTVSDMLSQAGLKFDLKCVSDAQPFMTKQGKLADITCEIIHECAGIMPARATGGGTSDARFIAPRCGELVEFGLVGGTSHHVDEHVSALDMARLTDVYEGILDRLSVSIEGQ